MRHFGGVFIIGSWRHEQQYFKALQQPCIAVSFLLSVYNRDGGAFGSCRSISVIIFRQVV